METTKKQKLKCESRITSLGRTTRCRRIARWKGYEPGPRGEGSIRVCTRCMRDRSTLKFDQLEDAS